MINICQTIRQAYRYKRNIEKSSRNNFCCGKAISISYFWCMSVALDIQYAKRMRRIILWSVVCLALRYFFPHYLLNGTICGKTYWIWSMCVLIFSAALIWNIYFYEVNSATHYYHKCTSVLTHWGRVTQICVFTLQLRKTDDANLRF